MIIDTINCSIKCDDGELEYIYNLTERKLSLEVKGKEEEIITYGVEAQSYMIKENKKVLIFKDAVEILTPYKHKAKDFINMLRRNQVSPVHLLNVAEEVIEEYYLDFEKVVQAISL